VFLGERVDWHLVLGSLLVVSGIVVVNWRSRAARPAAALSAAK
jgi:drug/metabolite transporter (DMT)-like permease